MIDSELKKELHARLKRIEGQAAGIRRMIENDKYCVDILLQISAARAALDKAGKLILGQHINTCVSDALSGGDEMQRRSKIEELMKVFNRYGSLDTE